MFNIRSRYSLAKKFIISSIFLLALITIGLVVWMIQPIFGFTDLNHIPKVNPKVLEEDVKILSTRFSQRNFTDVENLDQAASYIEKRFRDSSDRIELQKYKVDGVVFTNVIARFGPKIGAPIVIGAHYDAYESTHGADDNASGVAGLLALANLLRESPPSMPVELVAYTLEEPPIFRTDEMGSRQHAASLIAAGIKPRLIVVLEMIGYFNDSMDSQSYPFHQLSWMYPSKGNFIAVVGNMSGALQTRMVKSAMQSSTDLPVWSINAPSIITGIDFSDHASYWHHGLQAMMVTDTSFYRNPNYHKFTDVSETLDFVRMAKVVQGVYGIISQLNATEATK